MRSALIPALLIASVITSVSPANAQPTPAAPEQEYDALIGRALSEAEHGRFTESRVFFERAHRLQPSARTLRGIGLACYGSGHYVDALRYLREALASQVKPLTSEMSAQVAANIRDASGFIAARRVVLEPSHATVHVDGRPAVIDQGALLLDPGTREISVEAPGYQRLSRTMTASPGDQSELRLTLEALNAPVVAVPAREQSSIQPQRSVPVRDTRDGTSFWDMNTQEAIGLTVAAVGAVGIGVGSTFGLMAMREHNRYEERCPNREPLCAPEYKDHEHKAISRAGVATIGFVAGSVLLAGGMVVYFMAPEGDETQVALWPVLTPTAGALSLSGRF